jgi:superfamily I DNA/RNA helicase
VTEDLEAAAAAFATALPASVTLPAGTGKTHLLAVTVKRLVADGGQVLVLTHTNAGVHAIQKRLKAFGTTTGARVSTLTSFAFLLARAYPQIGELKVPAIPDWSASSDYIAAAQRIVESDAGQRILAVSFTHVLVDEYQDCSVEQHNLVCAAADAIPKTGILGDPLQAIFGFNDVTLVPWTTATTRFPDHPTAKKAWRWVGHNEELGAWLVAVRDQLVVGEPISFAGLDHVGINYRDSSGQFRTLANVALRTRWPAGESVVVLGAWKNAVRSLGGDLGGAYTVMEEVAGDFMNERLTNLAALDPTAYALWLFQLTKACVSGHAGLNAAVKTNLERNRPISHLQRDGLTEVLAAYDAVVADPSFATLAKAMDSIPKSTALRLHSHEAWYDIQAALRGAHAAGEDPNVLTTELARARDRVRHQGRRNRDRVVSRTLLVKGLEYDHVVIANIEQITDLNNLYVALTRARKSITIVGNSPTITVTRSN